MTTLRIGTSRSLSHSLAEYEARTMADAARRCAIAERTVAFRERTAAGIAPIDPADLVAQFVAEPDAAYLALVDLSDEQLVNQAIETASYVETLGKDIPWQMLLERWQQRIDVLLVAMAYAA